MKQNTQDVKENMLSHFIKHFKIEDVLVYVAVFTTVTSVLAFALRGLWYAYTWGYFQALKIDISYMQLDDTISLYSVLGFIIIMLVFCGSNYLSYWCVIHKKVLLWFGLILGEVLLFFVYALIVLGINVDAIIADIIEAGQAYLKLVGLVAILVVMVNLYGITYGYLERKKKWPKQDRVSFLIKSEKDIKAVLIGFVSIFIVTVAYAWWVGGCIGSGKTDFKVTVVQSDAFEQNVLSEEYIFSGVEEGVVYNFCVILYENEENYLLAYMYIKENNLFIDYNRQKVLPKENVVTVYRDIEELNSYLSQSKDKSENEQINKYSYEIVDEQIKHEKEENNMDSVFGTIMGAIVGGFISYLVGERSRKKNEMNKQSQAASILYYDLKSIEKYMIEENELINIRYSNEWQEMLARCSFLDDKSIEHLYHLYDEIYNYNVSFDHKIRGKEKFKKEKLSSYEKIRGLIWASLISDGENTVYHGTYKEILNKLQSARSRTGI